LRIGDLRVDELAAVFLGAAASAPEHRQQEMVMDDVALVAPHPHVEDMLGPLEHLGRHERLASAENGSWPRVES
jgi:hypothetical protein